MHKLILSALCAVAFSSVALAQINATGQRREEPAMEAARQGLAKMTLNNASFVERAAQCNLAEVQLSNLALRKNADPKVQSFAQQMLKDHTAANRELQALAKAKSLEVPAELDDAHRRSYERLSHLSDEEFNREYTRLMQEDHEHAVALFSAAAEDQSLDPQLQQFAAKILPTLRSHQQAAHELLGGPNAGY